MGEHNLFVRLWHGFRKFGLFVASMVNFILLLIVYLLGIGMTSLIGKLFGKSFLDVKKKQPAWIIKKQTHAKFDDYYRAF